MALDRSKTYYVALCVFLVVGGLATAYSTGREVQLIPHNPKRTPDKVVAYLNSYLNEKVNPTTLSDVLVTQYIEHPHEATDVMPLYPTQSIVQEYFLVNCSLTEIEFYLVPGEDPIGTDVGISIYTKPTNDSVWRLERYQPVSTRGLESTSQHIIIEAPRITVGHEGTYLRVMITNFGDENSDVVYVPLHRNFNEKITFSGINTAVDTDMGIFLTIKNRFRKLYGYRYFAVYEPGDGVQFYRSMYRTDQKGTPSVKSSEVIALFDDLTLLRKDSIYEPYIEFESPLEMFLPREIKESNLVQHVYRILKGIPGIGALFQYKPTPVVYSMGTSTVHKEDETFLTFTDRLIRQAQSDINFISVPVLKTLNLGREDGVLSLEEKINRLDSFEKHFVSVYNELESQFTYEMNDISPTQIELTKTDERGKLLSKWYFDLSRSLDEMVSEISVLDLTQSVTRISFLSLLNTLNSQYFSSKERGTSATQEIGRREHFHLVSQASTLNFNHLTKLMADVAKPEFLSDNVTILSNPNNGTFMVIDGTGKIVQEFMLAGSSEYFGISNPLVPSQENRLQMWLAKTFGPWANLQVPDKRPADTWSTTLYSMDEERDENDYWTPLINYSRPLALSPGGVGTTSRGWYAGNRIYDYSSSVPNWEDVSDVDWDTAGVTWSYGSTASDDLKIQGGDTGYWTGNINGHFMDNNGWLMLDLGDELPETTHWKVSFDIKKDEWPPLGSGAKQGDYISGSWVESGLGVHLTDDVGILELMTRNGTYSNDIEFWLPLQFGDGELLSDGYTSFIVYDPRFNYNYTRYNDVFNAGLPGAEQLWHWAGGTLNGDGLARYFHEMTYPHEDPSGLGVLKLTPDQWYHIDIYYDEYSHMLTILVDNRVVLSSLYMPPLVSGSRFENIWFYNFGRDTSVISNLYITDAVPSIMPFTTSVADVGRITGYLPGGGDDKGLDLTGAVIPYWNTDPLWPTQGKQQSDGIITTIGQSIQMGQGAMDHIYWIDMNSNGIGESGEYYLGDFLFQGKESVISSQYLEGGSTSYSGLLPLQSTSTANLLSPQGYNFTFMDYTVGMGEIDAGTGPRKYPAGTRDYSKIVEWDEFEFLLRSLLITDYDYTTTDLEYPSNGSSPWIGPQHHEVLWGDAVQDFFTHTSGGQIQVDNLDGWGMVLASLVSILDAASVYKVSPYWDRSVDYPSLELDQTGTAFTDSTDFWGFQDASLTTDRYWTPGYAGVTSFTSGGEVGLSSFYSADASENTTYGGRKWYFYGLDTAESGAYKLSLADLTDPQYNALTRFENVTSLSDQRIIVQGIRHFSYLDPTTELVDYETYSLQLASLDLDGDQNLETIVVPARWNTTTTDGVATTTTLDQIYDDPSDLFVKLIDEDGSGVFERYEKGPLGRYLAPDYMVGNAMNWIQLDQAERPSDSLGWLMESLSGIMMGFLETLPVLSDIFDLIVQTLTWGVVEILGLGLSLLHLLWDPIVLMILTRSTLVIDHIVYEGEIDSRDGTEKDDGRQRIDAAGNPSSTGQYSRSWGIKGNGLDDTYDQNVISYLRMLDQLIVAIQDFIQDGHSEFLGGNANEGVMALKEVFARAYQQLDPNIEISDWKDILHGEYPGNVDLSPAVVTSTVENIMETGAPGTYDDDLKNLLQWLTDTNTQIQATKRRSHTKTIGGEQDEKKDLAGSEGQLTKRRVLRAATAVRSGSRP
ncbi:MAG: hypothetical protein ACFFFG_17410 [Candidatus Thorarchaeota archaeon]